MIAEHDLVALTEEVASDGLRVGDVGTVVHCYKNGQAYEIEFIDERGRTKCVLTVPAGQVMRLNLLSLSA